MKILLSKIIQEVSERVWENQATENFWVNNKTGLEKSERRVSEDISNYKIIRHNYFAYNPYRVNVWSIGLFDWELWAVSPAYIVFKVDENKIIPLLLINFLKSQRWLIEINQHTHGWVRKSLSIWDLWKIEIDIPDIEKQKEFIDISDKHWAIVEEIWNINIDNQILIKRLRQSILQDAIQGQLVPQDSNDEPAGNLLKKIERFWIY
jgi:type I restriction enzyme S subunit